MQNGLYKVHFKTPIGEGAGVITLQDGKLAGGDSSMFYVGSYQEDGNQFHATVEVDTHTRMAGMASALGVSKGTLKLSGTTQGDTANMTGSSPQAPGVSFRATLSRIA